jgi:hypothetical protein
MRSAVHWNLMIRTSIGSLTLHQISSLWLATHGGAHLAHLFLEILLHWSAPHGKLWSSRVYVIAMHHGVASVADANQVDSGTKRFSTRRLISAPDMLAYRSVPMFL